MSAEERMGSESRQKELQRKVSLLELNMGLELTRIATVTNIEVLENTAQPYILAVTHGSNYDLTTVLLTYLKKRGEKPLKIVQSSDHNPRANWIAHMQTNVLYGEENFLNIGPTDGPEPILETLNEGNNVLVAAYYDKKYCSHFGAELPPHGGLLVPMLAMASGRPMIPVAVNHGVASVDIVFGNPQIISSLIPEDPKDWYKLNRQGIKEESVAMMHSLANLMPESRRGVWG